jgi:hypothetical protein
MIEASFTTMLQLSNNRGSDPASGGRPSYGLNSVFSFFFTATPLIFT